MRLQGKTALITGASRGIGAAIAEAFAQEGARVVLSARSPGVTHLAERLRASGYEADSLLGDVSDDDHARSLIQLCRTKFGGLDVLVNNAGILTAGKLGMIRPADVQRMFEVNVFSAINLTQYAVRIFPRSGGGGGCQSGVNCRNSRDRWHRGVQCEQSRHRRIHQGGGKGTGGSKNPGKRHCPGFH